VRPGFGLDLWIVRHCDGLWSAKEARENRKESEAAGSSLLFFFAFAKAEARNPKESWV
jgi:hypothetical protein